VAFVITEPCIGTTDQACVSVCPVDCIHFEEGTDTMLFINPAECIDCGACQPACPVTAIFPESDVPEASRKFIEINSLWFEDPAAARAQVGGAPAAAPTAAPAATAAAPAADATPAAETSETGAAPAAAPAATAAPAPTAPPARKSAPAGSYKFGENGVEGKCAICGTYVIKGGTRFREKSVLCPDCAKKQPAFIEVPGRR